MSTGFPWTEAEDEIIIPAWQGGASASQIAKQLSHRSRNSVIGRIHRLGLAKRESKPRPPVSRRAIRERKRSIPKPIKPKAEPEQPPLASLDPTLTTLTLSAHTCRWPFGDPMDALTFCGRTCDAERPYCCDHMKLAYQPGTALQNRVRRVERLVKFSDARGQFVR